MPKDDKPIKSESPAKGPEADSDVQQLQELYELMLARGLDSIELKDGGHRVHLSRMRSAVTLTSHPRAASPTLHDEAPSADAKPDLPTENLGETIAAPLAGVFYRASSPTSASFVKDGDV